MLALAKMLSNPKFSTGYQLSLPWTDSITHDASVFIGSVSTVREIMHNDSTKTLALMTVEHFLFTFVGSWEKVKLVDMSSDALEEQA